MIRTFYTYNKAVVSKGTIIRMASTFVSTFVESQSLLRPFNTPFVSTSSQHLFYSRNVEDVWHGMVSISINMTQQMLKECWDRVNVCNRRNDFFSTFTGHTLVFSIRIITAGKDYYTCMVWHVETIHANRSLKYCVNKLFMKTTVLRWRALVMSKTFLNHATIPYALKYISILFHLITENFQDEDNAKGNWLFLSKQLYI